MPATPAAAAGPASLLKTIATATTPFSGGGGGLVRVGSTVYFGSSDPETGYELWKTDGTAAGTSLVVDLNPGPDGSYPSSKIELNGLLIFSGSTPDLGQELYLTDGTAAGTALLKDIRPGPASSYPSYFTKAGSFVYFIANDGTYGGEIWRTDGTPAGTLLVADVFPGYRTSDIRKIVAVGNAIYVIATDATGTNQLFYSNGSGATKVTGIASVVDFAALNATTLLFTAGSTAEPYDRELYKAAGSSASLVKDIYPGTFSAFPNDFTLLGSYLYFQANDPIHGTELWRSDGTSGGTTLVKDIVTDAAPFDSSYPSNLATAGSYVYFQAFTSASGYELWRTDGTTAGTIPVKDIVLGTNGSYPDDFALVGSQVFFVASTTAEGAELWKTNGAAGNASLIKDINPGAGGSSISDPVTALGSIALFAAYDGTKTEIWRSDGTAAGTFVLRNIGDQPPNSTISQPTSAGGITYFTAQDTSGDELWRSDGTAAGTYRLKDIIPGPNGSYPQGLTPFGTKLLFRATDTVSGNEPFISDGTAGGTTVLRDINVGTGWSTSGGSTQFAVLGSFALFSASDDPLGNSELWKTDGTTAGTVKVKEINPPAQADSYPNSFAVLGANALFSADNGTNGFELWISDGTALGTTMVKNINTSTADFVEGASSPNGLTAAGGKVFFSAEDGANGRQLWASDGTLAGTSMVKLINPTGSALNEDFGGPVFVAIGSTVYFYATDGVNGVELWKTDGTAAGTVMVKDINPTGNSNPTNLTAAGNLLYFVADDGVNGRELWKTDGTVAGTVMVADLTAGAGSTSFHEIALGRADGRVVFSANAGGLGYELWQTSGTTSGTTLIQDINPGAGSSLPRRFHIQGTVLLFEATDGSTGRQLWSIPTAELNLPPATVGGNIASNGGAVNGGLTATDPDSNPLTFSIVTQGTKGTVAITNAATGAFTYTPNAGATGADSFTFTANDGLVNGNTSTISVTISQPPPAASPTPTATTPPANSSPTPTATPGGTTPNAANRVLVGSALLNTSLDALPAVQ